MDNEIKSWIFDIHKAISEIDSFFNDGGRIFINYQKDIKTKRAVERNLEIIGEAMRRILEKDNNFKLTKARKIVDTRNRIIHGYDSVSDEIIWSIVINHLPKLKLEISDLLNK